MVERLVGVKGRLVGVRERLVGVRGGLVGVRESLVGVSGKEKQYKSEPTVTSQVVNGQNYNFS